MSYVVFLPWVTTREPVNIGPLRLMPYIRGKAPGDLPHARQREIDAVLRAYSDPPRRAIKTATIVELGEFRTGMDDLDIDATFHAGEIVAYCALAKRRLFRRWHGYTNYDTYMLVAQRYHGGSAGTFSFRSRRRDGGTMHLWSAREFAFVRPSHVETDAPLVVDQELAKALLETAPRGSRWYDSISEFNAANTDAPSVREHVELVMMKSAFESLLDIGWQGAELVNALNKSVGPLLIDPPKGSLNERWREAKNATSILAAWAKEFCAIRNGAAHGQEKGQSKRFVWSVGAHLAFASLLHPMLMRKILEDKGAIEKNEVERARLERAQWYLVDDPFAKRNRRERHPWFEVEEEAISIVRSRALYGVTSDALDACTRGRNGSPG